MISKKRLVLAFLFLSASLFANNLLVESVSLVDQNIGSGFTYVQFDVSWDNSWRTSSDPFNYDAIWVFIKYKVEGDTLWKHASLSTDTLNHIVTTTNGITAQFKVGETNGVGKGVFIQRSGDGTGSINWDQVKIQWLYSSDGVANDANVTVKVFAIEMVYIPEGPFFVGDGSVTDIKGHLHRADDTTIPFQITSEAFINLGETSADNIGNNDGVGLHRYLTSPTFIDDFSSNDLVALGSFYPKGFNDFYIMKYEISQGQYKDFLNCLTREQQNNRTETDLDYNIVAVTNRYIMTKGGGSTNMQSRNSIKCDAIINPAGSITFYCDYNNDGTPGDGEHIAANFIHYLDGTAYADWAGLRPFTELEFEKVCRGANQTPVTDEYGWGNINVHSSTYHPLTDSGLTTELPNSPSTMTNGNAIYWDGGLITLPENYGPLRSGIFGTGSSNRIISGSSYYGVMDMTNNVWEATITIGVAEGRTFKDMHGDGVLYTNGEHNVSDWPGFDPPPIGSGGLRNVRGSGFRGGGLNWPKENLRISSREFANVYVLTRENEDGFRLARTAP